MVYDLEYQKKIESKFDEVEAIRCSLVYEVVNLQSNLSNEKAIEYLMQGALRRLGILARCITNIFNTFPVTREILLSNDELSDIAINLHAYYINVSGVFDNLAWVFAYENNLFSSENPKLSKNDVGLFKAKIQKYMKQELRDYLSQESIKTWHDNYSKIYRDSLAHRIPLYLPPSILSKEEAEEVKRLDNEINSLDYRNLTDIDRYEPLHSARTNIGTPSFLIAHSLAEEGGPVYFHPQILNDFLTVEECVKTFCKHF